MRISRRTSGGRGEYEISEKTVGGLTPHDLVDHRLFLNLGSDLVLDTGTELRHAQGKFRIRIISGHGQMQLHRQLTAALLLPEAIRSNATMSGGRPIIQRRRYAVETVLLDSVTLVENKAILSIAEVLLSNASYSDEELHFRDRVEGLTRLWQERQRLPEEISTLLDNHEKLVRSVTPVSLDIEHVVYNIQAVLSDQAADLAIAYNECTDALHPLLKLLEIQIAEPVDRVEDVRPEEVELRKRTVREWKRWASHRGTDSAKFRAKVKKAYNATCLVCGKRYPSTEYNRIPGVDAAHILPWTNYDLDRVDNGICLCKLCHWAFDEGIIQVLYKDGCYYTSVPQTARDAIQEGSEEFSLDVFELLAGKIPENRLPLQPGQRPNPQFLGELLQTLEG